MLEVNVSLPSKFVLLPKVISEPVSVIFESFKTVPSNFITLFVTTFVTLTYVPVTPPVDVIAPLEIVPAKVAFCELFKVRAAVPAVPS